MPISGKTGQRLVSEVVEMTLWIVLAVAGIAVLGMVSTAAALVAVAAEADREGLLDAD
ncbi:putative membrane protein YesL [Curtobacterium luteum]|uniref:Membrane protein YesL n=1 Tax=Curtobacterium luteum TaxID=33881 RepID=A0A8H9KX31_9MICO|nr:hypothetical protein [Curtobacterium luteum]MBM7801552.1 putative membrane protein YesL [Curtobacterium luteum]NUU52122.1 hypothetical protein [Curtobacterium luteum]GGK89582.1 hypothetical protein GCM10009769_04520 [Curtobacterium luteum]